MFLKYSHRLCQRTLGQTSVLRTWPIYFSTNEDGDKSASQPPVRGRYKFPEKKSFFRVLQEKWEESMMVDKVPQNESINSVLKIQRVNPTISEGFKTVYVFPQIKYFGLINRLKVYQTAFTIMTFSGGSIFCLGGLVSSNFVLTSTLLGIAGCLTLYSLGYVAAGFVGYIYYNDKTKMVRIAYVDFWGRRRDVEVPVNDIMPRNEVKVGLINRAWFPLQLYSTNKTWKLQIEQGIILDEKAFNKLL